MSYALMMVCRRLRILTDLKLKKKNSCLVGLGALAVGNATGMELKRQAVGK